MSDSLPPMADETLAAIEARLGAATPGPWSRFGREIGNEDGDSWYLGHDIEGPPEAERGQFERVADAELIANAPTDLRRLLDEVKRLNREFADFRQMAVLNSKAATEAVDRARSECAALAAKVGELEAQVESARRVEKGEPCPECGGTVSPWRDVRGKVGFHACTTCTWPLPGPDGKWRTAPGMPHTPAQGEWIPSMTGDECPHRPEWTCPDHAECRACECGCNTYVADLEEPDLTLIPAELVVRNPEVCSGRPTIRGTRILASTIAAELAAGTSWEQIHEWYPSMPRPAAQEAQERPGTREGDTGTGTGVQGPHGRTEAGR